MASESGIFKTSWLQVKRTVFTRQSATLCTYSDSMQTLRNGIGMEVYTISYDSEISLKVQIYNILYALVMMLFSWMHITDKKNIDIIFYIVLGMAFIFVITIATYPTLQKKFGPRYIRFDQNGIESREKYFQAISRIALERNQLVRINPISATVSYVPDDEKIIKFPPSYEQFLEARQKIIHWAEENEIAIDDWRIKARYTR